MQQAQQDRRHRRPGGVVERPVDGIQHPHPRRVDVRATEFLAVHLDSGRRDQRVDDLALDGEIDLGGEVVALLADRGIRSVAGQERLDGGIEDRRRLGHQCIEIHCGSSLPPLPAPAASVNRPA